jgi:hypothetical protein
MHGECLEVLRIFVRYGWLSNAKVSGATMFVKGLTPEFCGFTQKYLEVGMPVGCEGYLTRCRHLLWKRHILMLVTHTDKREKNKKPRWLPGL